MPVPSSSAVAVTSLFSAFRSVSSVSSIRCSWRAMLSSRACASVFVAYVVVITLPSASCSAFLAVYVPSSILSISALTNASLAKPLTKSSRGTVTVEPFWSVNVKSCVTSLYEALTNAISAGKSIVVVVSS